MRPVTVNGHCITEQAIAAELQFHPAPSQAAAWQQAATALTIRALLLQEAARLGIAADGEQEAQRDEAVIAALLAQQVHAPTPDDPTCRRWYAANQARFRSPDIYEAAHILFAAPPEDDLAVANAREAARDVLALLTKDPGRFANLARERSACPSAANGGRLGQQSRGDLVPEIETFVMALEEGQICPVPVMTRYGAHVLRLDRRVAGNNLPYEAVAGQVAANLAGQSWQRAVSQYLRILVGRAEIKGIEIDAAQTPLVQ